MPYYAYTPQNYICFLYHLSIPEWWDTEIVKQVEFEFCEKKTFALLKSLQITKMQQFEDKPRKQ